MKAKPEATTPQLRLIGPDRVCQLIDCARSHLLYLRRIDRTFPQPVRLGPAFNSAKRWAEHEVLAWMRARMALRGSEEATVLKRGCELVREALKSPDRGRKKKSQPEAVSV